VATEAAWLKRQSGKIRKKKGEEKRTKKKERKLKESV
jgi:hypothetical protein